ncbi:cysteate racemase [Anaeromicrobium sediminis]|uniref:Aspartate racemase n=1 Tax=Anaeromicrobium sediminis TaxID=1478221 RepID=A0A267MKZ4_9FIRM|nr:amino acid racemase [Anaeromicrobium sediminis]PAB59555.1 hypothetical protein CCE28_10095 [Anaeromicrobium sediminis]
MRKNIGILGGMGPMATASLFKKIISFTDADCDQDHVRIFIDNNTYIPDRTDYITGHGEDPRPYLIESAEKLEQMGADCIIMPCNTAHYFYSDIVKAIDIEFIHMIEETIKNIVETYPGEKNIGLLSTEGTSKSGIYDEIAIAYELNLVKPHGIYQEYVTDLIYGIKAGEEDYHVKKIYETINHMKTEGVNVFILGCTELSIAQEMYNLEGVYVDPMDVLAKSAIKFAFSEMELA